MSDDTPVELPENVVQFPQPTFTGEYVFTKEFGDPETLLNSRNWLRTALKDKGAKEIGCGFGMGQADVDIELEGCKFNVSIRPI